MTPSPTLRPKLYLAGPEVFLPNAIEAGRTKCALAADAGFEGLYPLDNVLDVSGLTKPEQAKAISQANETLMRRADGAIANLTPFRGASMDAGTAFEVGFMQALGKPVFGYTASALSYQQRAMAYRQRGIPPGDYDRADLEIEDFDLHENLMIDIVVRAAQGVVATSQDGASGGAQNLDGFKVCLNHARRHFFGTPC
jgi:nucleoside 2-deoxyribosyltransferase